MPRTHQIALTPLILSALMCVHCASYRKQPPPYQPPAHPRLTAIQAPEMFRYHRFFSPVLRFQIQGEDLDPLSHTPVEVRLEGREGRVVPALFTNSVTLQKVAFGDGVLGLDITASRLGAGAYRLCARAARLASEVCASFTLTLAPLTPCERAFLLAVTENPAIGCRCTSGQIRTAGAPDGNLGLFTAIAGGNVLGAFDSGGVNLTPQVTSVFKFEAHFTVEPINAPPLPPGCDDTSWKLLLSFLCDQGQGINRTLRYFVGQLYERRDSTNPNSGGPGAPYDPTPGARFDDDDYHTVGLGHPAIVNGWVKLHEPPDVIHWLDGPGIYNNPSSSWRGLRDVRKDHYFHAYVHGLPTTDANNCDCYFKVQSIVLNREGYAGSSSLTDAVCQ